METMKVIELGTLDELLSVLKKEGYATLGPTVREETIVYSEIGSAKDLPAGRTDEQTNGSQFPDPKHDSSIPYGHPSGRLQR